MRKGACLSLLCLLMTISVFANGEVAEEVFKPLSSPGVVYAGRMMASGQMAYTASAFRWGGGGPDWTYSITSEYRHFTIAATDDGRCSSAVRFFANSSYAATDEKKSSETKSLLKGRKVYVSAGSAPIVRPDPNIQPIDVNIAQLDLDDPFKSMLPTSPLKKDLNWQPDAGEINRIIMALRYFRYIAPRAKDTRWGPPPGGGPITLVFAKTDGKISSFKLDQFTADITFSGNMIIPISFDATVEVPFDGKVTLVYDNSFRAIKEGDLTLGSQFSGEVVSKKDKVPVKMNWTEHVYISREYEPLCKETKGLASPAKFIEPGSANAELVLAYSTPNGLLVMANWDGSYASEVLNKGKAIAELKELPACGGVSADGRTIAMAYADSLAVSTDYGESFRQQPWKNSPLQWMCPVNSATPLFVGRAADGSFFKVDFSNGKMAVKNVPAPVAGKKLVSCCPGGSPDTIFSVDPEGYYLSKSGSGNSRLKNIPPTVPLAMERSLDGVFVIAQGGIYCLTEEVCSPLKLENYDRTPTHMVSDGKTYFFLDAAGDTYQVSPAGGTPNSIGKEVLGIACQFGRLFMSRAGGLELR